MENANQTASESQGAGQTLAPLCTACCCGLLNQTLAVMFMVSLAFAIVVGNVVTITVFMQTRHSRTPQGYLKGNNNNLHRIGSGWHANVSQTEVVLSVFFPQKFH